MPLKKNMTFSDWNEVFYRRKWFVIFSILLITFIASVYCVVSKEMYRSTSKVLVNPPKVSDSYIKSTVSMEMDLMQKLHTLQLQIFTKDNLMKILDELGLFPDLTDRGEAFQLMKERINVSILGTSKKNPELRNIFSITYSDEDPEKAMLVNSSLTSLFIGENIGRRQRLAEGTIELFSSQIKDIEKQLESKDKAIKEFRTEYLGELPEQLDANLRMLERYKDELKSNRESIRAAKDRALLIDTQIAELKAKTGIIEKKDGTFSDNENQDSLKTLSLSAQIAQKRGMLSQLRLKYTESHPEIRGLKVEIAELEKELKKEGINKEGKVKLLNEDYAYYSPETEQMSTQIAMLVQQKRAVKLELKNLAQEQAEIKKLFDLYSSRVENTPKREHQLKELTRDYDNLKKYYEELLNKKMNADLTKDMERREQGEQFQLISSSNIPSKPYKPARMKIMILAVFLSIFSGIGGAVFLEYLDRTLKTPREFKEFIDVPVLVSLPFVITKDWRRRILLRKTFYTSGVILYCIAVITFVVLYMDKIKMLFNI